MNDHHRATDPAKGPPPTARQQRYIRVLALRSGLSFQPPRTRREASRLIDELRGRPADAAADVRRERRGIEADMSRASRDAVRIRDDELEGYGSSATWRGRSA